MEQDLTKIYRKSAKDITKKWNQYMEQGEKRLSALRESGSIREYQQDLGSYTLKNQHYKDMVDSVTLQLAHVNETALAYTQDQLPEIYAINYNQAVETADEVGISFTLINGDVVKRMVRDGDIELPNQDKRLNIPKDQRWNTKQLNSSVLQGILQGESMDKIANRILPIVGRNESAAIRNARTMVTGAENRGRLDSYKQLEEDGLVLKKVWMATPDGRTRDWHIDMDGQEVGLDENFVDGLGNELEYPGDPGGSPETVYNCRCTMVTDVVGFRRSDGSISYIDYEPEGESFHEQQMDKEKEARGIQPQEVKNIFTPAKTLAEAEQYAKDNFVRESTYSGNGYVSYKGLSVESANEINKTLDDLYSQYNMPLLEKIDVMNFRQKMWADSKDAPMAYRNIFQGQLYINPKIIKDQNSIDKYMDDGKKAYKICTENIDMLTGSKRALVEKYIKAGRQLVADDTDNVLKTLTEHEMGHHIQNQIIYFNKDMLNVARDGYDQYSIGISGYATSTVGEYVAESFAAYNNNQENIIDPKLKQVFDEVKK